MIRGDARRHGSRITYRASSLKAFCAVPAVADVPDAVPSLAAAAVRPSQKRAAPGAVPRAALTSRCHEVWRVLRLEFYFLWAQAWLKDRVAGVVFLRWSRLRFPLISAQVFQPQGPLDLFACA